MTEVRGTMVLDWDGVIEDSFGLGLPGGPRYDFGGIEEAYRRGYAVAVSTCNNTSPIAAVLIQNGFIVANVPVYGSCYWENRHVILVTNIKIHGWYVDDRALMRGRASPWRFPLDWREVFAQAEAAESHPEHYGWAS